MGEGWKVEDEESRVEEDDQIGQTNEEVDVGVRECLISRSQRRKEGLTLTN
jgi:hypothetical protein